MVETTHSSGFWPNLYEPFRTLGGRIADWFAPASEAGSSEAGYRIEVELPGVKPEDVDISMHDHVLVVKGEKRTERHHDDGKLFFSERQFGSFQRTFRLPPDADTEKIEADFSDGLLSIRMPRAEPVKQNGRKIEIKNR
ncbi:MAG: Hsp20/alpha crystallin family protein [Pseudomonadota bacterium]